MTVVKMYFKIISLVLLMGVVAMNLISCSNDEAIAIANNDSGTSDNIDDTDFVTTDWTIETHSKDVDPNYSEVFNDMAIKRLDIVITEERW
jgi:hypothetical protein